MRFRLLAAVALTALSTPLAAQTAPATLASDQPGDDIVVTGQRRQQERSIEAKRLAIGVTDVAAGDEIGRLADKNVAEVIEHLPGVGVTYDQGEGRYVAIRGVPSNLNNYTLNGVEIGNPDGTTRSLPLDIVSGQLLNRVEINKVKTADMDGQGIGGTVNLVTQTAFDFANRTNFALSGKAGKQELNDKVPYQIDGTAGARFGSDGQFGIVVGASYSDRNFNSEGFYPDNWKPLAGAARGGIPDNIKYTEYSLDRQRIGAVGSLDWHPNEHQTFFVRAVYSRFIEDEVRPRYRLDFTTTPYTLNPDGLTGTAPGVASAADGTPGSGTERREDLRLDYKAKSLATGIVGGSSAFGALKLDYEGAYSRNRTLDRYPLWQFRCNPGPVNFDFGDKVYSAAPVTECSADQLQFRQYQAFRQLNTEEIWQGKVDGTYALAALGAGSFIKFGAKYRDTTRDFDQDQPTWVRGGTTSRWTLGQYGLGGPGLCVYPNSADTDQCYYNSPTFNIGALQAFTQQHLGDALMPLDAATTLTNNSIADFHLKEDVAAAYIMANLRFGALTITPGLRYEHTRLDITGYQLLTGTTTVAPAKGGSEYGDWLPSIVARISPNDTTIFRFAYSKSIGRPEYSTLSPGGSIDSNNAAVSLGNPNLKPYRADNLDATAEWYFARGGLLSVGVFAKFIRNPIFSSGVVLRNTTYNGVAYPVLTITQPLNADKGDIIGIEGQYQQQFTFLPGLLSGFGISLNGTLTQSTLHLPDGRSTTFPSQSTYLYGAELFYQKGGFEASVAYHNTGHSLIAIGTPAYNDQYNDDLRRLDAKASLAILRNITLFFEAQNLTDEPTRQYQAGNPDWLIQNERYGRTFYGGVSVRF